MRLIRSLKTRAPKSPENIIKLSLISSIFLAYFILFNYKLLRSLLYDKYSFSGWDTYDYLAKTLHLYQHGLIDYISTYSSLPRLNEFIFLPFVALLIQYDYNIFAKVFANYIHLIVFFAVFFLYLRNSWNSSVIFYITLFVLSSYFSYRILSDLFRNMLYIVLDYILLLYLAKNPERIRRAIVVVTMVKIFLLYSDIALHLIFYFTIVLLALQYISYNKYIRNFTFLLLISMHALVAYKYMMSGVKVNTFEMVMLHNLFVNMFITAIILKRINDTSQVNKYYIQYLSYVIYSVLLYFVSYLVDTIHLNRLISTYNWYLPLFIYISNLVKPYTKRELAVLRTVLVIATALNMSIFLELFHPFFFVNFSGFFDKGEFDKAELIGNYLNHISPSGVVYAYSPEYVKDVIFADLVNLVSRNARQFYTLYTDKVGACNVDINWSKVVSGDNRWRLFPRRPLNISDTAVVLIITNNRYTISNAKIYVFYRGTCVQLSDSSFD